MRKAIGLWLVLLLAGLPGFPVSAAEKMSFVLGWIPYGRDAGFFAALDEGFYKRAGLDVTLRGGFRGQPPIERLESGNAEFAFGDVGSLLFARAKGLNLRLTAMVHAKTPYVLFTFKGLGIEEPGDLEGKSIAVQPREAGYVIFPALLAIQNIDEKKIRYVFVSAARKFRSLLAGKVQATMEFAMFLPSYRRAARRMGKTLVTHFYSDWGLDIYSAGLTTTGALIEKNPDLVRKFTRATMKGFAFAVENPEKAVDDFMRRFPEQSREIVAGAWDITVGLLFDEAAKKNGIGYIDKEKMTFTRDLWTRYRKVPLKVPVEDIYTLRFLPKLFPKRKR